MCHRWALICPIWRRACCWRRAQGIEKKLALARADKGDAYEEFSTSLKFPLRPLRAADQTCPSSFAIAARGPLGDDVVDHYTAREFEQEDTTTV